MEFSSYDKNWKKKKKNSVVLKWNNSYIYIIWDFFLKGEQTQLLYGIFSVNLERPREQQTSKKSQKCYPNSLHFPSTSILTLLGQFIHLFDFSLCRWYPNLLLKIWFTSIPIILKIPIELAHEHMEIFQIGK